VKPPSAAAHHEPTFGFAGWEFSLCCPDGTSLPVERARRLLHKAMGQEPDKSAEEPITQTEWVEFRRSVIHGTGGFARKPIPRGTYVLEYVGERITKSESLKRCEADNPFIFTLDEERDLDGNVEWNPARFLNHSCEPNCDAEQKDGRIWIIARRDIAPGEEIAFNYGYDLEDYNDYPCQCGAPTCVGFMVAEEFFDHVRKRGPRGEPQSSATSSSAKA